MNTKEATVDLKRPALVLMYGTTEKKRCLLDRDVIIVGRVRGCDVGLDAPDVSSLHCVISRSPCGFSLRDCGSRAGTRLNGDAVQEATLRHEDIVQIGPFSFRVHLPGGNTPGPKPEDEAQIQRLERSRRNLARIALAQRRRLSGHAEEPLTESGIDDTKGNLSRKALALRARVKDYDQRVRQLEQAEREVARDRDVLNQETADLEARMQEAEEKVARRRSEFEAEVARRWEELEQRLKAEQARAAAAALEQAVREVAADRALLAQDTTDLESRILKAEEEFDRRRNEFEAEVARRWEELEQRLKAEQGRAAAMDRDEGEEETRRLEARRAELATLATQLDERLRRLDEHEQKAMHQQQLLTQGREQMQREHRETLEMREAWLKEQAEASARLAQQSAAVAQAEAVLREQRNGLLRMMAELKQLQASLRTQEDAQALALRKENEELRQALLTQEELLGQREQALAEREGALAERDQALAERDDALAERDQIVADAGQVSAVEAPSHAQVEELGATIETLRALLKEKDGIIEEMQQRTVAVPMTETDMETYEAELNAFRQQLETDRQKLGKEIEALRGRNAELHEATRELELEMSRERAELVRERTRLERLREEMRLELERVQREAGMRERLAPVQKLREEIVERRQGPTTPQPNQAEPAMNSRLRNLRNRINDG